MTDRRDPGIEALRSSHDDLQKFATGLADDALARQSYCTEWSVAQVLSHLGSSAEIRLGDVEAAIAGHEPPSRDTYPPIWDRWNALAPPAQRDAFVEWDTRQIETFEGFTDAQLTGLRVDMYGRVLSVPEFVLGRLGEHALHAWDVYVSFDDTAVVAPRSVALLVDRIPSGTARYQVANVAEIVPFRWGVVTTDPDREFVITADETVTIAEDEAVAEAEGVLSLPAEAFLRLSNGRLDPEHTPDGDMSVEGDADVVVLRRLMRGL